MGRNPQMVAKSSWAICREETQQMGNDEGISPSPDDPKDPKCLNRMCGPNRGESFNLEDRQKHFVGYDNH